MSKSKQVFISSMELEKLKSYNEQLAQINQVKAYTERAFTDALELIGDRYGVNLIDGSCSVQMTDGMLVSSAQGKLEE